MSEREERRHNLRGQLTVSSIGHQFVPCTGNWNQLCWAGNHLYRFFHFYNELRPHSAFPGDVTPFEVYRGEAALSA